MDRDGTINIDKNHLYRIEDWEWIEGAIAAIRAFNQAGHLVIVVTNQAGIARGLYDSEDVEKLHAYVQSELAQHGARIDRFYFCPHHPDYGDKVICDCRKPKPGMIKRAGREMNIDLSKSWLIGDKDSDIFAGLAANVRSIRLEPVGIINTQSPYPIIRTIREAIEIICPR